MTANPNHHYFDGFYQEIWQQLIPTQLTEKEIQHLLANYGLNSSTRVLDLMCGYGRHSLALARKGIGVTAIDNLSTYIRSIEEFRLQESLPILPIHSSVLDWQPTPEHDWALCMGNSLNFFSPSEMPLFFKKVFEGLRPGGYLWINSWSISEIILQNPMDGETQSTQIGRFHHTNQFTLKQNPLRLEIQSRIEDETGQVEQKLAVDYLYSLNELQQLLAAAGFTLVKAESVPGKKEFEPGDPRVYILSQKNK
jgi:cyclopropane fatty-acyl-phospholipid synthase-like methyltransferase